MPPSTDNLALGGCVDASAARLLLELRDKRLLADLFFRMCSAVGLWLVRAGDCSAVRCWESAAEAHVLARAVMCKLEAGGQSRRLVPVTRGPGDFADRGLLEA